LVGEPNIGQVYGPSKSFGHDADYRVLVAIDRNIGAQHVRVCPERVLPKSERKQSGERSSELEVLRTKASAEDRLHLEDIQKIRRYDRLVKIDRRPAVGHRSNHINLVAGTIKEHGAGP